MVRTLAEASIPAVARLLANNPLHQEMFGEGMLLEPLPEPAFTRLLRRQMHIGTVPGAYENDELDRRGR
jgi:hypothetical protein